MNASKYWFVMLALLLSTMLGTLQAQEARTAFAKSLQLERLQRYPEAIAELLPQKDASYQAKLRLGWLYYLSGNYLNSQQHYQAAITAAPKAVEPRLGLTLPLLAQEKYEEVEKVTRAILLIDANNYLATLRLTFVLRMQGKFAPAYELNSTMLELYPTDLSFLTEQLLTSVALKNKEERKWCDAILNLDQENATALAILAKLPAESNASTKANGS